MSFSDPHSIAQFVMEVVLLDVKLLIHFQLRHKAVGRSDYIMEVELICSAPPTNETIHESSASNHESSGIHRLSRIGVKSTPFDLQMSLFMNSIQRYIEIEPK
jgi:hypothetical protein